MLAAVHDAARRYPLDLGAFGELVDGVEMDVTGRHYATFDDLVAYCTCVAGSVGRLSLAIFSATTDPVGDPLRRTPSASRCSRPTSCATCART